MLTNKDLHPSTSPASQMNKLLLQLPPSQPSQAPPHRISTTNTSLLTDKYGARLLTHHPQSKYYVRKKYYNHLLPPYLAYEQKSRPPQPPSEYSSKCFSPCPLHHYTKITPICHNPLVYALGLLVKKYCASATQSR